LPNAPARHECNALSAGTASPPSQIRVRRQRHLWSSLLTERNVQESAAERQRERERERERDREMRLREGERER
jgi:hypothetical protein